MTRFRFGVFEFNAATGELSRDGTSVKLQSQPGRVLGVLLARAGEVVTRDELRLAVWGSETFVDFDRGLNFCIAQIRSALGDSADSPRFVRTMPKQGYKFVAPVEVVGETTASAPAADIPPGRAPAAAGVPRVGVLVAALVAVIAASWAFRAWSAHSPVKIAVVRFDNQTGNPDLDRFADGLTDSVVAELTAAGGPRFGVIGNAPQLRAPRNMRSLRDIADSLGVGFAVLGQVQSNGAGIRVLAHLIRLSDQTHVTVSRQDLDTTDPTTRQTDIAKRIASDLASRLDPSHAPPRS